MPGTASLQHADVVRAMHVLCDVMMFQIVCKHERSCGSALTFFLGAGFNPDPQQHECGVCFTLCRRAMQQSA
jgi:hypothetical protein